MEGRRGQGCYSLRMNFSKAVQAFVRKDIYSALVCTCTLARFLSLPPLLIAYTYMQSCTHTADGLHTMQMAQFPILKDVQRRG